MQPNSFSRRQQEIRIFFSEQGFQLLQLKSRIFIVQWNTKQSANLQRASDSKTGGCFYERKSNDLLRVKKPKQKHPTQKIAALADWKTKGKQLQGAHEKLGYSTQLAEDRWLSERHLPKSVIQSLIFTHPNEKSKQKDGAWHSVCQHEYLYIWQHKKLQLDDVKNKPSRYLLTTCCCSQLQGRMQHPWNHYLYKSQLPSPKLYILFNQGLAPHWREMI